MSASPLRFAGYAALFDHIDRGGDIVARGAFADTLKTGRAIPLLWQHDPRHCVGVVELCEEDARGLRVIGRLHVQASDEAAWLRSGAVGGLSFGYRVRASQGTRPRRLIELDLVEISLVTFPMQPSARVHLIG